MKWIVTITFVLIVIYLSIRNPAIYTKIATKGAQFFRQGLGIVTGV